MKMNLQVLRLMLSMLLLICNRGVIAENLSETEVYSFTSLVSMETLQSRVKELEESSSFEETTKNRLLDLYRKSMRHLEEAQTYNDEADKFIKAGKVAPKQAASIRNKLEKKKKRTSKISLAVNLKSPFTTVQQHLQTEKANLAAVEAKLTDLKLQRAFIASRANSILQQLNDSRQEQEKIFATLESEVLEKQSPRLVEAQKWAMQTQAEALRAKIRMLDQELLSQPMRIELLNVLIERQVFSVDYLTNKVKLLNEIVTKLRKKEAEKTLRDTEKAKREVLNQHPANRYLAKENSQLSTDIHELTTELDRVTALQETIKKQEKHIANDFSNTRKKVEIAGLSHVLGQILMEQRMALPDIKLLRDQEETSEERLSESALTGIRHKEELRRITQNREEYIQGIIKKDNANMDIDRKELDKLIGARRKLLKQIIDLDDVYFRAIGELGYKQRKLITTISEYHDFLVGRSLWVRSSPYPSQSRLFSIPGQIKEFADLGNWLKTGQLLGMQARQSPGLLLLIPLLLLSQAKRLRVLLVETSKKNNSFSEGSISDTLKAILFSLLLAAPGPIVLLILAWTLRHAPGADDFTQAIAAGLFWVAPNYFYLRMLYVLCKPGGVVDFHFGWPLGFLTRFRRELKRLMFVFLPLAFFTSFVINYEMTRMGGELGRILAVSAQLILAYFFYRLFKKKEGVLQEVYRSYPHHAITRFSWLWFSLTGLCMLLLSLFTMVGYVYSGAILTNLLLDSVMLVVALVFAQQLSIRWLSIVEHRLTKKAAREQKNMSLSKQNKGENQENEHLFKVEKPKIDLYTLNQDIRILLDTIFLVLGLIGLGWLWSEVLPAFQFLDEITLWYHTPADSTQSETEAITLADLGLAGVIVVGAYILAKRLPALLEIILLQLSTSTGSRYTITTLTRYAIFTVGFICAFSVLGVGWSQLQWLIAALGVGIGFGLQEIVANFICGLIILFERPIRVGDVVTVGDTDGIVTRIQIRATTIRNWDKKELLVPNKEFVTGRLLNWSLSDEVTRILVTVGVAYGSDIQQAKALMLEVADSLENVLKDPKPSVTFESFGDNALTLVLRCYVATMDHRLSTISRLHEEINQKLSDGGISIAFPQRDIHLDTLKPLDVRIHYPEAQNPDGVGSS